jgi:hypothetical protein
MSLAVNSMLSLCHARGNIQQRRLRLGLHVGVQRQCIDCNRVAGAGQAEEHILGDAGRRSNGDPCTVCVLKPGTSIFRV